jgi:hypothetical protein
MAPDSFCAKDSFSSSRLVGFRPDAGAKLLEVLFPECLPGLDPRVARKRNLGSHLLTKETQP